MGLAAASPSLEAMLPVTLLRMVRPIVLHMDKLSMAVMERLVTQADIIIVEVEVEVTVATMVAMALTTDMGIKA